MKYVYILQSLKCCDRFYPPTQKIPAVKPGMNALDGPSEALPSRTGRRRVRCFGGFRRRNLRYHGRKSDFASQTLRSSEATKDGPVGLHVGLTENLKARLKLHNEGQVFHTAEDKPWRIKTYLAFTEHTRAVAFEKYLKTASGRAFSKKGL